MDWVGTWVAEDGKTVVAEYDGAYRLTVSPERDAEPYASAQLLGGGTKRIERIEAAAGTCDEGPFLELEAGTPGLGPTYRVIGVSADTAHPEVGMGMYDDYDDDLGVPWAFPLLPLRRQ